jgi:hypothetical protein
MMELSRLEIERWFRFRVERVWLMEVWAEEKMSSEGSRGGDIDVG